MKQTFYLLVLTLMLGVKLFGQQTIPTIWEKKYGGSGKDKLFSAIATSDGNYLVLGMTDSKDGDQTTFIPNNANLPEIWILKIRGSDGEILWRKLISEKANLSYYFANEPSNSLVELSDSYVLSLISTYSVINNLQNIEIIKLNKQTGSFVTGNLNVSGVLGVGTSISKTTISKHQNNSGSFIIGASNYSADARLLLINSSNTISKTVTKPSSIPVWGDYIQRIESTPDGGYLLFGSYGKNGIETTCYEPLSNNVWVAKFDQNLTLVWSKDYGGKTQDNFLDVIILPSSGFYLLGSTDACLKTGSNIGPNGIGEGTWLMQLDQNGNVVSQPRFIDNDGLDQTRAIELNCKNEIIRIGNRGNVEYIMFDSPSWDGAYFANYLENFIDVIRNPSNNTYLLYGNALTAGDDDYFLALKGPEPGCGTTQTNFCTKATKVDCGGNYPDQTTVGAGNILSKSNYSCTTSSSTFNGPERIYEITLDKAGELQVGMEILDAGVDLDLFLLADNCQTVTCLAKNTDNNSSSAFTYLQKEQLPAGKYYVVVEGYAASVQGRFNINFACNPLDCNTSVPLLKCGVGYDGRTYERTNNVSIYRKKGTSTLITNVYGSEAVHKITLKSRQEITIAFNRAQSNLMLFLLESNCNKNAYLDRIPSGATGTSTLKYTLDPGDYYLAVDGLLGTAGSYTLTYTLTAGCTDLCSKAELVDCGSVLTRPDESIGFSGSNDIQLYTSCTGQSQYLGKEKVYKITLNTTTSLQVGLHLLTPGVDLDLFLITTTTDCSQITCDRATASGINRSKYLLKTLERGTYYFVVDALGANTQGSYRIDFACGELNCNVSTALSCRAPNPGSSFTGSNDVSIYGVKNGNNTIYYPGHVGKEKIYQFDVFEPQTITLTLAGQLTGGEINPDLSLFLFSTCNKTQAIASSVTLGSRNESISIQLNPGTYYAVVDEFLGSSGNYSLSIQQTQPCANICDYGGEPVYRGIKSSSLLGSDLAPLLLYYESCVRQDFGNLSGKKLYADIYTFYNDEDNKDIYLTLFNTPPNTYGYIFKCNNSNSTCVGSTKNSGSVDLYNQPKGFYYVVIISTGTPSYSFSIFPPGDCMSDPEKITIGTSVSRSVSGKIDNFNIGAGGADGYSSCYNGARSYRGEDLEFSFTVESSVKATITLNSMEAMGIFLYGTTCGKGCITYAETGPNGGSTKIDRFSLTPGTYYIIVDKNTVGGNGLFSLNITTERGEDYVVFVTTYEENCPKEDQSIHNLRIPYSVGNLRSLNTDYKLHALYPITKEENKESSSDTWNSAANFFDFSLKRDQVGGEKCGFVEEDSILLVLSNPLRGSIEHLKASYATRDQNNSVNASSRFRTGGYSVVNQINITSADHFGPNEAFYEVSAEGGERYITFGSSERFYVQTPTVDWIKVLNPASKENPHRQDEHIRYYVAPFKGPGTRTTKLVFISVNSTIPYRAEVTISQKACAPLSFSLSTNASSNPNICQGTPLRIEVNPSTGSPSDYGYEWGNKSTQYFLQPNTQQLGKQSFRVTVTGNENQCYAKKTDSISVTILARPSAPIAPTLAPICQGETAPTLSVSSTPGANIRWYDGPGSNARVLLANSNFYKPNNSLPGVYTYYAEAYNSNGCISEPRTPVRLTINASEVVEGVISTSSGSTTVCLNTPLRLHATSNTGSTVGYSFTWGDGSNNSFFDIKNSFTGTNTYTVTVIKNNTQCQRVIPASISITTIGPDRVISGTIQSTAPNNSICIGNSVNLTVKPDLGTSSDYIIKWEDGSTLANRPFTPPTTGTFIYSVTISGKPGQCLSEKSLTYRLNVLGKPEVVGAIPAQFTACPEQSPPQLSLQASENASLDWYNALNGGTLLKANANPFIPSNVNTGENIYYVQLRGANGCTNEKRIPIKLFMYPKLTLASSLVENTISCFGEKDGILNVNIKENVPGGFTYAWADGFTAQLRLGLKAGNYPVTVSYGDKCKQTFTATLTEPAPLEISVIKVGADTNLLGTGAIDVTVTGGTPPYFYEWIRNGVPYGKSQDLKRIPAGNYHLEVYDAKYCTIVGQTITIQSKITSTQDHPWTSLVKIAPNPTNGLLNVSLDLPQSVSIQPEVISPLGVTVIKLPLRQLQKGSFEVNLENHPSGVYFLKLNLIESTIIKRILLVH